MTKFLKSAFLLFISLGIACPVQSAERLWYAGVAASTALCVGAAKYGHNGNRWLSKENAFGVACGLVAGGAMYYNKKRKSEPLVQEILQNVKELKDGLKNRDDFVEVAELAQKEQLTDADAAKLVSYFKEDYFKRDFELVTIVNRFGDIKKNKQQFIEEKQFFAGAWPIFVPLYAAAGIFGAKLLVNASNSRVPVLQK